LIIAEATHEDQHRVSATHDERNIAPDLALAIRAVKKRREQVSFEMIDC
jgi:hypothetical protein